MYALLWSLDLAIFGSWWGGGVAGVRWIGKGLDVRFCLPALVWVEGGCSEKMCRLNLRREEETMAGATLRGRGAT